MVEPADQRLEERLSVLIDKVIRLMPKKGRAVSLYATSNGSYDIFESGIMQLWKSRYENGDPVTRWKKLSKQEFLSWVYSQPQEVQERVSQNISDYITNETPQERGEVEFPRSRHLFGY